MIPQKQLSLADIFEDCKNIYDSDKPQFLTLLENHIDLDEIIPVSFYHHYYASTGRNRKYPLTAMLLGFDYSTPLFDSNRFSFADLSPLFQTSQRIQDSLCCIPFL